MLKHFNDFVVDMFMSKLEKEKERDLPDFELIYSLAAFAISHEFTSDDQKTQFC